MTRVLLVAAAPVEGTCSLLPSLAADVDLVIAVDGGGRVCLEAGVMPDIVLGDFDSLSPDDLGRLSELGASIMRFPAEKDASDLELALLEARRAGAGSVVVTAAMSGRLDHTLVALGVLSGAADLKPHVVEPDLEAWVLSATGRSALQLAGTGATFSVIPLGGPAVVSVTGAAWELSDHPLEPSASLGLSNRVSAQGQASVSVSSGIAVVIAPKSADGSGAQAR